MRALLPALPCLLVAACASVSGEASSPRTTSPPPDAVRVDASELPAAAPPAVLGLAEIRARILEHANLRVAAELVRIEEARAREDEAALWPNPYILLRERRVDDLDPIDTGMFEVEVGQTFELGGKRAARVERARAEAAVVSEQVRVLTAETLLEAELAYWHVLRLQQDLAWAKEERDVAVALADLGRSKFQSGRASRASVLRIEAAAEKARIGVDALERRIAQGCRGLDDLVGASVGATRGVEGDFSSAVLEDLDRESARALLASHPRLRATERAAEAARREIESARADVWPDVTVGVAYEHENEAEEDLAGFVVRLPLPLWNRAQGRRAEARAALRRARLGTHAETLRLAVELESALLAYDQAARSAADYATAILPRLEESFLLAQSSFDAGRISHFEVLDVHLALIQARRARLDYLEEQGQAAAAIRYLIGTS